MRNRIVYGICTLVLVGTVAAQPVMAAGGTGGTTLQFTEKVVRSTQLDLGKHGLSQGDMLIYRGVLLDKNGHKAGDEAGQCVSVVPRAGGLGLTHCQFTNQLPGGQLTFQGVFDFTRPRNVIPVIGGSGRYRGASGQLASVASTDDQFTVTETISLTR